MPQPAGLDPGPYSADSGQVGALLIHGFTGAVAETRPMGEYLAARGLSVRCPLLPGHGTSAEDLTRIGWRAWAAAVEAALHELQGRCEAVFVGGLSLGSLLALWLGACHAEISGLVLMAPAVQVQNRLMPLSVVLRHVLKYRPGEPEGDTDLCDAAARQRVWCYDRTPLWGAAEVYLLQRRVRKALPTIRQPILLFQGRRDATLKPTAAQAVYDGVASRDKTLVWLKESGHNLLADGEREAVWEQSYRWIMQRAGG
ncbi:MAG TPA: alpha/beta fold hydrolase [Anaerolineae bacterium]|nr:alpha/beta fold hydrolase [Anaerolineae bacterium]